MSVLHSGETIHTFSVNTYPDKLATGACVFVILIVFNNSRSLVFMSPLLRTLPCVCKVLRELCRFSGRKTTSIAKRLPTTLKNRKYFHDFIDDSEMLLYDSLTLSN